jgi:hypothetical protein
MPDESLKVDVGDTDEQETEIDLEAPAQEKSQEEEIHVEQVAEDNSQPANASQESNEQSDVQASEQKKELDDYSEGVQKRIAKLTRKMREAERQKEEAIKYAQQMREQAEKTKNQFDQLGTNYTKELEQKVSTGIEAAKAKLKAAAEAGDIDAQVEAQKAVAQMAMEEARLNQLKVEQEARLKKTPQPTENIAQAAQGMPTSVDIAQAGRQLDPKAEAWATKNTWFGTDNAMTYTAFDIHRKLVEEEGFDPQSQEYYNEVDKRIRLEFPHKFDNVEQPTKEQPVQNVASAKRPAGKGRRKTVKLTPSQVAISKRLGVPLEEYAKQLAAKEG